MVDLITVLGKTTGGISRKCGGGSEEDYQYRSGWRTQEILDIYFEKLWIFVVPLFFSVEKLKQKLVPFFIHIENHLTINQVIWLQSNLYIIISQIQTNYRFHLDGFGDGCVSPGHESNSLH